MSDSVALALVTGTFGLTGALYARLPPLVPTHFNFHGAPDGWMSREVGAWLLPVTALVAWAIARFGAVLLPTSAQMRMQAAPIAAVSLLVVALMTALQCVVLHAALSHPPSVGNALGLILGAFWVVLGLFLPRVRRNPWVGVRTPWTLTSDENWARTHRVAGLTFCLGGATGLLCTLLGAPGLGMLIIILAALVPVVYSYGLARRSGPHA